jgi:ribonuclease BN (tRNA processing enzyme)
MKLRTSGLLLTAVLLAGCWQKSVHPFYTEKDLVAEPKLSGTWKEQKDGDEDNKMIWTFNDATPLRFDLTFRKGDEKLEYDAHVFRLEGTRFLDIMSRSREVSTLPVHHLFKIEELGATLKIAPLSTEWMQKWLRKNPASLAHVVVIEPEHRDDREQDELVLTADTKALQSFLRTHLNDEGFFTKPTTFIR